VFHLRGQIVSMELGNSCVIAGLIDDPVHSSSRQIFWPTMTYVERKCFDKRSLSVGPGRVRIDPTNELQK
jgi:hypothetical protein